MAPNEGRNNWCHSRLRDFEFETFQDFFRLRDQKSSSAKARWHCLEGRPCIYQKKYNLLYKSVDRFWFGKQDNFSKFYGNLTYVSCIISISWLYFPSHLKKLHSTLRFRLLNLNCGFFFHSFHSWLYTTKQLSSIV